MERRRQRLLLEREYGLHESGNAGRRVDVANVRFDRAQHDGGMTRGAKHLAQRRNLDRIADRRAGAVRLHVRNARRLDPRDRHRLGDHARLAADAGRGKSDLVRTVVVDGRPFDHGADGVAVPLRVGDALERHDAGARRSHGAGRGGIEGTTVAVGRTDRAFLVTVARDLIDRDRHAARQGEVTFVVEETLTRDVDGHQRRRTRRLDHHAGPAQSQLVGHQRGEEVAVVGHQHQLVADSRRQLVMSRDARVVPVETGPGKDADRTGIACGIAARILERTPHAFEEHALLRVHDQRFVLRDAEERRIERVGVRHRAERRNEAWVSQQIPRQPAREQVVFGKDGDRLCGGAQVLPVLGGVTRTRQATAHADDRDVVRSIDGPHEVLSSREIGRSGAPTDGYRAARARRRAFARAWLGARFVRTGETGASRNAASD